MKTMSLSKLLIAVGLCAGATGAVAQQSGVIARGGDAEIKAEEVRAMIDKLDSREQEAISRDPSLINQSVRQMLVQRLVLKEALAKKWDKQPETVVLLEKMRDAAVVESYLQSVCKVDESYPGEAELKAAYEANKASLVVPRQYKVAQIYVAAPKSGDPGETEKAKSRVEAVKKSLGQPNADFAAIAIAQSEDNATKKSGGEIGWLAESQMQAEIRPVVSHMVKSSVSDPVRMDDGWHILKCLEIREARTASLDEVKGRLAQSLREERARSLRQAYMAGLVRQNPLSVNELALSGLLNKSNK